MNLFTRVAIPCLLASVAWVGPAAAADYDPPLVVTADELPVEEYVPVEVGNGWYIRGDIGYDAAVSTNGGVSYRTFDSGTSTYSDSSFAITRLGRDFSYNVGFGYQYNSFLRGDLTLSSFQSRFDGTTTSAQPCDPAQVGTTCRSEDSSSFTALTLMANGYVDLGTFAGFTPYAGAGLGMARVEWRGLTNSTYCVDGANACSPTGLMGTTVHPGEASWRFSYALMGGVAYDISKNLKLDLGYKYQWVDGDGMFGWDAASAAAGATGTQGHDSGFSSHEVRVGLRYALW